MANGYSTPLSRSTRIRKAGLRARAGQGIPAERTAFPDPKIQWLEARLSAYRCGGSTGIALNASPVSRFTLRQSHCNRAPIGLLQGTIMPEIAVIAQ